MKIGFFFWPFNVALAFGAGYLIGDKDPLTRGVPPEHREGLLALVRSYSTRPGAQNIKLVKDLGSSTTCLVVGRF